MWWKRYGLSTHLTVAHELSGFVPGFCPSFLLLKPLSLPPPIPPSLYASFSPAYHPLLIFSLCCFWMNALWLVEHMLLVVQYPPSEQGRVPASVCVRGRAREGKECHRCVCVTVLVRVCVCGFIETYASCCTSAICSLNGLMECCCYHGNRPFSQTVCQTPPGNVCVWVGIYV